MLTSKQRAHLRAMANGIDTILYVGKGGITQQVCAQADSALTARELIKGRVQEGCELSAREAGENLARDTGGEVVQVIGTRFILYRRNEKDPKITLPK